MPKHRLLVGFRLARVPSGSSSKKPPDRQTLRLGFIQRPACCLHPHGVQVLRILHAQNRFLQVVFTTFCARMRRPTFFPFLLRFSKPSGKPRLASRNDSLCIHFCIDTGGDEAHRLGTPSGASQPHQQCVRPIEQPIELRLTQVPSKWKQQRATQGKCQQEGGDFFAAFYKLTLCDHFNLQLSTN